MPYFLSYQDHGAPQRVEVGEAEYVIGRAPDCNLVLVQAGISRNHCRIVQDGDDYSLEDLNSKNGTRVNGIYVKTVRLGNGDVIQIGEYRLEFQSDAQAEVQQRVVLSEEKALQEEAGTIIRHVNELKDIIAQYEKQEKEAKAAQVAPPEDAAKRIMSVLIDVAKTLIQVKSLSEILHSLMDLIFAHLPADRGFVMLADENDCLEPKVIKHRHMHQAENIEISKTIAEKVFHEDVAILTTDAQVDPRFSAGESIRFLGIKSAMCVPLFHKNKTIGIIYLDSPTSAAIFGPMDLDLLTAMANFAAVGIEQAQLSEKVNQETKIRHRLERYHSPSIVNRILKSTQSNISNEFRLSVQERDVTVLFADIVGFTPMAERMPPSQIALLLNDYFSEMTDVVFKYEGTLDKYIGDAIMAIFGAPDKMPNHPERAVLAALDMLRKLETINAKRTPDARFSVRIGINSGRTVAGDIGSIKRLEYTVLGNTVNVAARIESSACKPNQICVGASTYERIKDKFVCESLGAVALKGITVQANVYRVIRKK